MGRYKTRFVFLETIARFRPNACVHCLTPQRARSYRSISPACTALSSNPPHTVAAVE